MSEDKTKEEISVAENAWNKLRSALDLVNPILGMKDIVDYTVDYFDDTKAYPGARVRVPKTEEDKENYFLGLLKQTGSKLLERLSDGLSFLNFASASQYKGALRDARRNGFDFRRFGNTVLNGNSGFVSPEYAEQHPIQTMAINGLADAGISAVISAPKSVLNLAKSGIGYLDDLGRNMTPPAAPVYAVVGNGTLSFTPRFEIKGLTSGSTLIPAANLTGLHYMALGEIHKNPLYKRIGSTANDPKFYPEYLDITENEQAFMREMAEANGIDLSKIDLTKLYKAFSKQNKNQGTIVKVSKDLDAVGITGESSFPNFLYRIGRILHDLKNYGTKGTKVFDDLGVIGAENFSGGKSINPSDGRSLAGDVRAQIFEDGSSAKDILSGNFDFNPETLLEYLESAHGGAYLKYPHLKIKGIKVKKLTSKSGVTKNYLDWDDTLSEEQINEITNLWKQAIMSYKDGNKLIPRKHKNGYKLLS